MVNFVVILIAINWCCNTQWTGQTAIMMAAGEGHTEVVRILLEAGADLSLANAVRLQQ